jgi:hypothetical protein
VDALRLCTPSLVGELGSSSGAHAFAGQGPGTRSDARPLGRDSPAGHESKLVCASLICHQCTRVSVGFDPYLVHVL